MVLWGGREFLSQHERIMVFFVSRFFSWQSFLTHQSLCLEFIFFKTPSQSLLELWIPWLHEPDRRSAAQVRVTFAPSACQEAFALLQDYCSLCHATRQKHFCHRENTFLTLGNWKPAADSPWSAMPQYPQFIPILFFKFPSAQQQQLSFMPPAESTGNADTAKSHHTCGAVRSCPLWLTAAESRVQQEGAMAWALLLAHGQRSLTVDPAPARGAVTFPLHAHAVPRAHGIQAVLWKAGNIQLRAQNSHLHSYLLVKYNRDLE